MKFQDPFFTAKGEERAYVDLLQLQTLWLNTGSICNLACENCYIESSPRNDRLSFLKTEDIIPLFAEIRDLHFPVSMVGLTGGEPFANPQIIKILKIILDEGLEALVLTNGFKAIRNHYPSLQMLQKEYGDKLNLRISLDHYTSEVHERERGEGTFDETLSCLKWLRQEGFSVSLAGRSLIKESADFALESFQKLLDSRSIPMKLSMGRNIVIFPEMDLKRDVPEITVGCWNILSKRPQDQMCATERMVVKKKGSDKVSIMPCTLLAYDEQFDLGSNLNDAQKRVQLNHPFCAEFCVLGGASCSSVK